MKGEGGALMGALCLLAVVLTALPAVESAARNGDFLANIYYNNWGYVTSKLLLLSPKGQLRNSVELPFTADRGGESMGPMAVSEDRKYAFIVATIRIDLGPQMGAFHIIDLQGIKSKVQTISIPVKKGCQANSNVIAVGKPSPTGRYALYVQQQCALGCRESVLKLSYDPATQKIKAFPKRCIMYSSTLLAVGNTVYSLVSNGTQKYTLSKLGQSKALATASNPIFKSIYGDFAIAPSGDAFYGICSREFEKGGDIPCGVQGTKVVKGPKAPTDKDDKSYSMRYNWDNGVLVGPDSRSIYVVLRDSRNNGNTTLYTWDKQNIAKPGRAVFNFKPFFIQQKEGKLSFDSVRQLLIVP